MKTTASIKYTLIVEFDDDGVTDPKKQAFETVQKAISFGQNVKIINSYTAIIEDIQ